MKKQFILLYLLSQFCFSQNYTSIKVNYKAIVESITIDPKNVKYNDLFEEMNQSLMDKSFLLQASSKGFTFEEELMMEDDVRKKKIAKISSITFSISDFFYDKEKDKLFSVSNNR